MSSLSNKHLAPSKEPRYGCRPNTSSNYNPHPNYLAPGKSNSKFYDDSAGRNLNQIRRRNGHTDNQIHAMFDKCFAYENYTSLKPWVLPNTDGLFKEYYQFQTLQELKMELNQVKSKLNNYALEDWSYHTRRKDPAVMIPWRLKSETKAEFVTVAWCKFYECLGKFPELIKSPQVNTLHLCEAPGAFITALNHYLYTNYDKNEVHWNWLATTLNPYYEGNHFNTMIWDDRFILYTLDNWLFHKDFTGNIIDAENLLDLEKQCQIRLGEIHLITADGSVACVDAPDCQEENVALLLYAEIIAALTILSDGGSFIIKMFTLFEASSVSQIYLLNCVFEKVHVFKPCTSKCGNSEVYVVCLNYKKQTKNLPQILKIMKLKLNMENLLLLPLFSKSFLPEDFLNQHEICCRTFMNYQIKTIERNIRSFETPQNKNMVKSLQNLKEDLCNEFYKRYNICELPDKYKILYKFRKHIEDASGGTQLCRGSYVEREMFKEASKEEKVFKYRKRLNELDKILKEHLLQNENKCLLDPPIHKNKLSAELTLYRGKGVASLNSSLFTNYHLFVMRCELNELFAEDIYDALWLQQPRVEFNSNGLLTSINFNDSETISTRFSLIQEEFFKNLIFTLLAVKPEEIKFINMPFLTHYAVSILRYLSCFTYSKVLFSFDSKFEITLTTCGPNFVESLEQLKAAFSSSLDGNILCFINIMELHHNDFSNILNTFNNMVLLDKFQHLLNN